MNEAIRKVEALIDWFENPENEVGEEERENLLLDLRDVVHLLTCKYPTPPRPSAKYMAKLTPAPGEPCRNCGERVRSYDEHFRPLEHRFSCGDDWTGSDI